MNNQGWISLHRKIQDNPMYFCEPFNRILAWIDILLLCNYQDNYIFVRGNKVDIKRGQFAWGEDALANRWRWSRGKVRRFLNELEKSGNIVQQKNNILSLYTIPNYDLYQRNDTTDGQQTIQQTDINNNVNNVNKVIDNKLSIQPPVEKPKKIRDIEIDNILKAFEEVYGTIPLDGKPRQWGNHIKRILSEYLKSNNSQLTPSQSFHKFLIAKRNEKLPITFNKLQTIYYHLRSTIYKNEHQREQNKTETA